MHSEDTQREGRAKGGELCRLVQPIGSYGQTRVSLTIPVIPGL